MRQASTLPVCEFTKICTRKWHHDTVECPWRVRIDTGPSSKSAPHALELPTNGAPVPVTKLPRNQNGVRSSIGARTHLERAVVFGLTVHPSCPVHFRQPRLSAVAVAVAATLSLPDTSTRIGIDIMRFSIASPLLLLAGTASAASSWGFSDASVTVSTKGAGSASQPFAANEHAKKPVVLSHVDTLKVSLTTKEGSHAKRAHQAFLVLTEASGLENAYPLTVKPSGKGSVEINQKDLPIQLLLSDEPLKASLLVGSFGSAKALVTPVFDVKVQLDPNVPAPQYEAPVRYGKRPEIHHIFRSDAKSPPVVISLVFALAVVAAVPVLFIAWGLLGANLNHINDAISSAPISHTVFFGSIVAIEVAFFLYYSAWNLFQTLPVIGVLAIVAFLSGTKALSEVQGRRLAGKR